jgi:hypothetical protein
MMSDPKPELSADTEADGAGIMRERLVAAYEAWRAAHPPWHMLVPESIGGGFGWCIDCLRIVPVSEGEHDGG